MNAQFDLAPEEKGNQKRSVENVGMSMPSQVFVHAKLEMTSPGDSHEEEADEMADSIINDGKIARSVGTGYSGGGIALPSQFGSRLASMQGHGSRLYGELRSQMETGFGRDFSDVRLHTDEAAAEMSDSISARAFTYGNDIYFNRGQFEPGTTEGRRLVAHELTHVAQGNGKVGRSDKKEENEITPSSVNWKGYCDFKVYSKTENGIRTIYLERSEDHELKNKDEFWVTFKYYLNYGADPISREFYINSETERRVKLAEVSTNDKITDYSVRGHEVSLNSIKELQKNPPASTQSTTRMPKDLDSIRMPVGNGTSFEISQGFDSNDTHNSKNEVLNQHAIDIKSVGTGTEIPVVAVGNGVVIKVIKGIPDPDPKKKNRRQINNINDPMAGGNQVYIFHTDKQSPLYGYISIYMHLKNSDEMPSLGAVVMSGARIGTLGNTGYSIDPHLHFSIIDPHDEGFRVADWGLGGRKSMDDSFIKGNKGTVLTNGDTKWED